MEGRTNRRTDRRTFWNQYVLCSLYICPLMKEVSLVNNYVLKLLKSVHKKRRSSDLFIINKFISNQIGAIYYLCKNIDDRIC